MFKGNKNSYKILGFCAAGVHLENVKKVIMSISNEAMRQGYKIFLFNPFDDMFYDTLYDRGTASIYRLINPEMLDALIVLPESIKNQRVVNEIVNAAHSANLPVISVDRIIEGCPSITFDYADTFEQIVRHVVEEHKCRRVNLIAGFRNNDFSLVRENVYKKVLAENGIEFEDERLGYGDFWESPTKKVVEDFINSSLPFPEAIICCNDTMAIAASQTLREHGIRVPEDVIVTGFDGIEQERYTTPRLTTAAPDISGLGQAAMEIIEKLIAGEETTRNYEISYQMRLSQSCGCLPQNNEAISDKITQLYRKMNNSEGHEAFMFEYLSNTIHCKSLDEIAAVMSRHCDRYCWLCINSDFFESEKTAERYHDCYTKNMNLLLQQESDKMISRKSFPTEQMLPDIEYVLETYDYLMFSPIHFSSEVIGYMAVSINSDTFVFQNTRRFLNNTNQILMSYKTRLELERVNAELAEMHMRDPMTGIYNRRGFYQNARRLIADSRADTAVIFSIDMDGLKYINDTFGHSEGDRAINAVSTAISNACKHGEVCARFGGDEFIVLSVKERTESYITGFVNSITTALDIYNSQSGAPYMVQISCGTAETGGLIDGQLSELIKIADEKMYEEKRIHKSKAKK